MGPQSIAVNIAQEVFYPHKLKQIIATPMGPVVQAFDGTKGWMAQGPQSRELPEAMAGEMRRGVRRAGSFGVLLEGKVQAQALHSGSRWKEVRVLLVTEGENSVQLQLDPERICRCGYSTVGCRSRAWRTWRATHRITRSYRACSSRAR